SGNGFFRNPTNPRFPKRWRIVMRMIFTVMLVILGMLIITVDPSAAQPFPKQCRWIKHPPRIFCTVSHGRHLRVPLPRPDPRRRWHRAAPWYDVVNPGRRHHAARFASHQRRTGAAGAKIGGLVAPLATKVAEIQHACGSRVTSAVRPHAIVRSTGH